MAKNDHRLAILVGVTAGIVLGLNLLALIKGFEGGLIGVLRELLQRLH